jgi:hypothetical protein
MAAGVLGDIHKEPTHFLEGRQVKNSVCDLPPSQLLPSRFFIIVIYLKSVLFGYPEQSFMALSLGTL